MIEPVNPGLTASLDFPVPVERTVAYLLPEAPEFTKMPHVLATGFLVGLVEWTCMNVLADLMSENERTVGIHLDLTHEAPTVPGDSVHVEAELAEVKGREFGFAVRASNLDGTVICRGSHWRALIELGPFQAKAEARRARTARSGSSFSPP